jgi:aryl-alcohol dehydrogenase-like predicted oxidoreductase
MLFDPFGGSVSLNGDANRAARDWFLAETMPIFAYSSLARGFFSGKIKSDEGSRARELLSATTVKEYAYPPNFERLRRTELLAKEKDAPIAAIALAWLLLSPLDVHPIVSPGSIPHFNQTREALAIKLTEAEREWLNLERESL